MAPRNLHHVGIAVDDLDASLLVYEELFGARLEHRESVEDQGVEAASLRVGESRIELLRPLGPDTPVGRFLAKRGPGMHHVAFEVDDVGAELVRLRAEGAQLIDDVPRRGLFGLLVPFSTAEDLDRALAGDHDSAYSFEADDGRYTISLQRVVFVKRWARESRVGFGSVA